MRAVVWSAVSSKPQAEKDSLAQQQHDARAICEQRGWHVVAELEVPGHSRSSYWQYSEAARDMEAYAELQHLAQSNAFDVLICRSYDRLGRSDSLLSQVLHLFRENAVQVFELNNPTTLAPIQEIRITTDELIKDAFKRVSVQSELIELRRRHRRGMQARVKHKGLPSGELAYGYRYATDNTVPPVQIPDEIAIIRKVRELYLRGWGYGKVAGWLNENKIPPRRAQYWRDGSVRKILRNPFYVGVIVYGAITAPGGHEPVWSPSEWVELRAEHARRTKTRGKSASVYSGIVRCRECGLRMIHNSTRPHGYEYHYFVCNEGARRGVEKRAGHHRCSVRVERIREAVLAEAERLLDPAELKAECRDYAVGERASQEQLKLDLGAKLEELGSEVRRLLDAHTRWGRVSVDAFDEAMAEAEQRQAELAGALADVQAALDSLPDPEVRAARLTELASDITPSLDSEDVKEANAWLAQRIKAIWCEGNEVVEVELV